MSVVPHHQYFPLFCSLDVASPEKRARVENGDGDENGSAAAANGDTESPMDTADKPEVNLVKLLQNYMKFIVWEKADAEYFLKNVRKHRIMSDEDENKAMAQILQSFVDGQQPVRTLVARHVF